MQGVKNIQFPQTSTVEPLLMDSSILTQTSLYYGQFTWSEGVQNSYNFFLYNTDREFNWSEGVQNSYIIST